MDEYRVLIVDDQRDVRRVLRAALESLGPNIRVFDVPSGEEAILVISRQPIDLMVADVRLPGISGLELKVRAEVRNPNMRMVLITGLTDSRTRREVENAGVDGYFFKPIDMGVFLALVEGFISKERVDEQAVGKPAPRTAPGMAPASVDLEAEKRPAEEAVKPGDLAPPPPPFTIHPGAPLTPTVGLSERLTKLRHELAAECALLVDERGQILAQAGEPPLELADEAALQQAAAISASITRLSLSLGANLPRGLVYLPATSVDLYITHVGQNILLLLALKSNSWPENRLGDLLRIARLGARDLLELLAGWGVQVTEEPILPPDLPAGGDTSVVEDEVETVLPELDAIFQQVEGGKLETRDADAFWESAVVDMPAETQRTDGLTYDEAKRLGLAPDDK